MHENQQAGYLATGKFRMGHFTAVCSGSAVGLLPRQTSTVCQDLATLARRRHKTRLVPRVDFVL